MSEQFTPWSDYELNQLRELSGKHPSTQISKMIGRGTNGIQKMARKLGLPVYVKYPSKQPVPEPVAPVQAPVAIRAYVEPSAVLRQTPKPKPKVSYPPTELCPVHGCLVSDWPGHVQRLGNTCQRPAV